MEQKFETKTLRCVLYFKKSQFLKMIIKNAVSNTKEFEFYINFVVFLYFLVTKDLSSLHTALKFFIFLYFFFISIFYRTKTKVINPIKSKSNQELMLLTFTIIYHSIILSSMLISWVYLYRHCSNMAEYLESLIKDLMIVSLRPVVAPRFIKPFQLRRVTVTKKQTQSSGKVR